MQTTASIQDRWKLFDYYELLSLQETMQHAYGYSNIRSRLLDQVNKELYVRTAELRIGIQNTSSRDTQAI